MVWCLRNMQIHPKDWHISEHTFCKIYIFSQPDTHHMSILGYRESAYLWALSSAGAAWGVATACAQGWLGDCDCDSEQHATAKKTWEWGGCSYGVHYGIATSRRLLTKRAISKQRSVLHTIERHNLKAGRLVCLTLWCHFRGQYPRIYTLLFRPSKKPSCHGASVTACQAVVSSVPAGNAPPPYRRSASI
jgi:hypothetical protein